MAQKVLFQSALTDVHTGDREGVANVRIESDGKKYRYVKNVSATALVHYGAALKALTTTLVNLNKNVRSPDMTLDASMASAQLSMPAGVPQTAIAASGSLRTGAYGWVQIAVPAIVNMMVSATTAAASSWPGRLSICTNLPASAFWDVPENGADNAVTIASATKQFVHGVELLQKLVSGTAANFRSATVEVRCE